MSSSPPTPQDQPLVESIAHTANRARAEDWSLVLQSVEIPNQVVLLDDRYHLVVAARLRERAHEALLAFAEDQRKAKAPPPRRVEWGPSRLGVVLGIGILAAHTALRDQTALVDVGLANSGAILRGEWFRILTAQSLHADYGHAVSNAVSCGVFASLLFRSVGPGLGLTLALAGGAIANAMNAWLHGPGYSSLGASTALFAVIGALSGLQFAAHWRYPVLHGRRRSWLPLAASLGLLAMLGTGGARTDVLGHLLGLFAGTGLGAGVGLMLARPPRGPAQWGLGLSSIAAMAFAWIAALHRLA